MFDIKTMHLLSGRKCEYSACGLKGRIEIGADSRKGRDKIWFLFLGKGTRRAFWNSRAARTL